MSVLRERDLSSSGSSRSCVDMQAEIAGAFPGVLEMLAAPFDTKGKPREGSTLLIFVEDGLVKVCITDRHQDLTGWVTAKTMQEALDRLENGLQDDRIEWRVRKAWKAKK
jgi:hypothetical protein